MSAAPSPFTQHSSAGESAGSRRASAYQQSHARRASVIPPHLFENSPSSAYGSPSPSAYGSPNPNSASAGSRRSSANHARRGSVIDIAADMLAGQAGVESLEKARKVTDKVEDTLEQWVKPVRPWLPGIGRFLIVVTFLEDALRILTQLGGKLLSDSESHSTALILIL